MNKIIILLALCCSTAFLKAQEVKKDSVAALQLRRNLLLIDSVHKAFDKEKDVRKKEVIFNDFFNKPASQQQSFARYKAWMQRDLAQCYAAVNDVKASESWLGKISDGRTRSEGRRLAAVAYAEAGNLEQGIKLLKPVLDSLLQGEGTFKKEDAGLYSNTVGAYVKVAGAHKPEEIVGYLKPLYNFSGKFFPSDISERLRVPELEPSKQLFYIYAKALPQAGFEKEKAYIIATAFQLKAVPEIMQRGVRLAFSEVRGLDKYLKEFEVKGKADFQKNLGTLLAKSDRNGKVWGNEVAKNKYILLDFWGSWCLPCRFTHPHLKEVYAKYKDKGFEIIGIAMEASPELEKAKVSWNKAITEDGIGWVQFLNNENVTSFDAVKAFGIGVFPTKILLDHTGKELARYSGGSSKDFDEKMKTLFGF
uniref:TlpA family protein disulfide reductase n=1 Tax=Pedobacter schmidteae TaxID=2201271 RepID=UPI000EAF6FBF|nr:TlpA disulfide reductase family protein [Pedobacter schmidteae]